MLRRRLSPGDEMLAGWYRWALSLQPPGDTRPGCVRAPGGLACGTWVVDNKEETMPTRRVYSYSIILLADADLERMSVLGDFQY